MADSYIDDPEEAASRRPARDRARRSDAGGRRGQAWRFGAVLLVLGAAIWGYYQFREAGADRAAELGSPAPVYLDLEEILVNLDTEERPARYLRARISLELPDQSAARAVRRNMPRVLDQFQVYMRDLSPEELAGAAAMFRLKEELLRRVNAAVAPAEVRDVLFRELLVQ